MSLPSIPAIANERGFDLKNLTRQQSKELLVEAMRRDLPLAIEFLHQKAHEVRDAAEDGMWTEEPNSIRGKQLIRLHASDALRTLAREYFCHGLELSFANCCNGKVGTPPPDLLRFQIETQAGPLAYADC